MINSCNKIIFSNRAYNSIVSETYDKIKTETGGILLGRIIEDIWYVIEVIDPGPNSIFTIVYFEYDTPYVNHLAKVISKQYKIELAVLGLWHRHPSSMDTFSSTDNGTNSDFAKLNMNGAISGLVNIDPDLRLTMYHVSFPLRYTKTPFEIGDLLIPFDLFKLKFSQINHSNLKITESPIFQNDKKKSIRNTLSSYLSLLSGKRVKSQTQSLMTESCFQENKNIPQQKTINEDFLLELYSKEEYLLETTQKVKYENNVTEDTIFYSVNEFENGQKIESPITFDVNFDGKNPLFHCENAKYKFSEGIFNRYVESKIQGKPFIE